MKVSRSRAFEPIYLEIAPSLNMARNFGFDHNQVGVVVLQIEMVEGIFALFAVAGCRLLLGWQTKKIAVVDLQPAMKT